MRSGQYAPVTGAELREVRQRHHLSQVQLAVLACSSIDVRGSQLTARRVQAWEAGKNRMPLAAWEVLSLKLKLMEHGATYLELVNNPAADIVASIMDRYRDTLRTLSK